MSADTGTYRPMRNNRKRNRMLTWANGSGEGVGSVNGEVYVGFTDRGEPDRRTIARMSEADAVKLAGLIAHQTGYRLIEVQP